MLDKDKATIILMLIATLLGHIEHTETTKKVDKLRKQCRFAITKLYKSNKDKYKELVNRTDEVWKYAKDIIADNHFEIVMSESLNALYGFISDSEYKSLWFTKKTFTDALNSISDNRRNNMNYDVDKTNEDSNTLVDYLQEALGLSKKSKLSMMRKNIYNHLVIEGKIR